MAKLTTSDLTNLENQTTAVAAINNNFAAVETAMENTLSRDGTSPNTMSASLDMNSNRITNLPVPVSSHEPARKADTDAIVASAFPDGVTFYATTAVPAGGTTGTGLKVSSTENLGVFFGSGAPTLSAAKGSLYLRTDGSTTNDRMYVNTNGSTTWTAVTTAA